MYPEWSPEEVAEKLTRGEKLNLVDVRERDEWQQGHIAQARLIPLSELTNRLDELKQGNEPIIMVCRSGGRSGKACDYLASLGYSVINMKGGMLAWTDDVVTGD
ncbi:rhodanese-like domain-containing protein [Paenibacillus abyssi]|uniref:Rhodanese-like domain-containing protein n=1 Tax=Paenibacillus abyssi TaxID=1340531 RepID=A0A917FXN7_9BACL|nr:rhodanese-like domain-containing protein [Paenibacillus abyssi]GGG11650.1 rhodanese-like domain-containing protein [Paenibacillus abyssi]